MAMPRQTICGPGEAVVHYRSMGDVAGRGGDVDPSAPPTADSAERTLLKARIDELVASASNLRERLRSYEESMAEIRRGLDEGRPALDASEGTAIPSDRRLVSESIRHFELARHELRVALIAAGRAEGASVADVAAVLGISRQLAYRLAARG